MLLRTTSADFCLLDTKVQGVTSWPFVIESLLNRVGTDSGPDQPAFDLKAGVDRHGSVRDFPSLLTELRIDIEISQCTVHL